MTTSSPPASAEPVAEVVQAHTISLIVDNESGVLARVVGLFSGRGYNIESLTVAAIPNMDDASRVTIVTSGNRMMVEQIKAQLDRLIPVRRVTDLTIDGPFVGRELALIKVVGQGEARVEALRLADAFRARVVDSTKHSFVFELTGSSRKIDAFLDLMQELGLIEVSRTGVAALARGDGAL
ncbi:MAG: acetolactate synthase small subunit [Pseudomonadota bacterium]